MADIKTGAKLNVLIYSEKEEKTITLVSSMEGFGQNKRLIITAPTLGVVRYPLSVNQEVTIQYYDKSAVIAFEASVLQRIDKDGLSYLLMEQKSEFRRTQRRQDFRMECSFNGFIEYEEPEGELKKKKIVANDISAGGTAIRSDIKFEIGKKLNALLPIGENDEQMRLPCVVCRCMSIDDPDAAWRYNIGLQFLFDDKRQKEQMVARIFAIERARRSRSQS